MPSVTGFSRGCTVGRHMRIEDPDIKESASFVFVPDVVALMSDLAPSSVLLLRWWKLSPLRGCWQTSVSSWAKMSQMTLCCRVGIAPLGQMRAWLTLTGCPQGQCKASFTGVQPYLSRGRLGRPIYAVWCHTWVVECWWARTIRPSHWLTLSLFAWVWIAWTSGSWPLLGFQRCIHLCLGSSLVRFGGIQALLITMPYWGWGSSQTQDQWTAAYPTIYINLTPSHWQICCMHTKSVLYHHWSHW